MTPQTQHPSPADANFSALHLEEMVDGLEEWKCKTGYKKFLLDSLFGLTRFQMPPRIYDAAMGAGYDIVYLMHQEMIVTGNEIDPALLKLARKRIGKQNPFFNKITQFDWREISPERICPEYPESFGVFNAVLCLGNSITYLFTRQDQLKALGNFYEILKPKGRLVIDERNYQAMFDHTDAIREGRFEYTGAYRTSAQGVQGIPIAITENEAVMEFRSARSGNRMKLSFYPFKKNELLGLLRETGFRRIDQYSDFQPGFNPDSDFYQYVCVK